MAIDVAATYPGRSNPASADYPFGSIKNKSAPELDDGTPLDRQWGNDLEGFFQSLMVAVGFTPSGVPDKVGASQRFDALIALIKRYGIPYRGVIAFAGTILQIPNEYALCNGANGTPDLRDRFIVGAGSDYNVGDFGGENSKDSGEAGGHSHILSLNGGHSHSLTIYNHTLSVGEMPIHGHGTNYSFALPTGGSTADAGEMNYGINSDNRRITISNAGGGGPHNHGGAVGSVVDHSHIASSVSDHTHSIDVRPPYYALAWIMKLAG